jgi:hypothetical protein
MRMYTHILMSCKILNQISKVIAKLATFLSPDLTIKYNTYTEIKIYVKSGNIRKIPKEY